MISKDTMKRAMRKSSHTNGWDYVLKCEFFWRLKYLKLLACRNPVDEIANTAKNKRLQPILFKSKRERVHETLNFLAVIFNYRTVAHSQWVGGFVYPKETTKILLSQNQTFVNIQLIK
jgi:hypothetical protein